MRRAASGPDLRASVLSLPTDWLFDAEFLFFLASSAARNAAFAGSLLAGVELSELFASVMPAFNTTRKTITQYAVRFSYMSTGSRAVASPRAVAV